MENIINILVDTVVNVSVQLWDALGIPACLGILITWLTQRLKFNPHVPYIEAGKTWIIRGFVVLVGTILQLIFLFASREPVTWQIVQEIAMTYLASSVAYTHLFKK